MRNGFLLILLLICGSALHAQWEEFPVLPGESLWASSALSETLGSRVYHYPPENLFDGDRTTAWVEGIPGEGFPGEGIGETLTVLVNRAVTGLALVNGYAKSPSLYEKNNRIRSLKLSLLIGFTAPGMISETDARLYLLKEFRSEEILSVKDIMETQSFKLSWSPEEQFDLCRTVLQEFTSENPYFLKMMLEETGLSEDTLFSDGTSLRLMTEVYGFIALRLSIDDVYRGSHYNDTCLSELSLELEEF